MTNDIDHGALSEQADNREMDCQQIRESEPLAIQGTEWDADQKRRGAEGRGPQRGYVPPEPPAPDPTNWQTNTTSELGALLYHLFGPFSRIAPHRKFPFAHPLPFRDGRTLEYVRAFASPSALVITHFTGICDVRSYLRVITEPGYRSVDLGNGDMPTWGALTGGSGTWRLAEPILLRPNCSLRVEYYPPHHGLPQLAPPPEQVQLCAQGIRLDLGDWRNDDSDTDTDIIKRLEGKAGAETIAFLDEMLEQARKHLHQEPT